MALRPLSLVLAERVNSRSTLDYWVSLRTCKSPGSPNGRRIVANKLGTAPIFSHLPEPRTGEEPRVWQRFDRTQRLVERYISVVSRLLRSNDPQTIERATVKRHPIEQSGYMPDRPTKQRETNCHVRICDRLNYSRYSTILASFALPASRFWSTSLAMVIHGMQAPIIILLVFGIILGVV